MSCYRETETDRKNKQWFANNKTCNTLQKIAIEQSSVRGVGMFEMEFNYPISVIVGENGSGKSTVLSLISCAFHNNTPFCPMSLLSNKKKVRCYYTYSDFFAFAPGEVGFGSDIKITSSFLTDKTKNTDTRSKTPRGKWKDYDTRPKRAVSFLGINRILPPSESLTYRNYCSSFGINNLSSTDSDDLAKYMQQIFVKPYSAVSMKKHRKYRLYGCSKSTASYTGFNMGAGENAVLQLLHEIITAGNGALIVVDEIELGLHVRAQRKLMKVLKDLCLKYHTQLICSSHSSSILESVPPEGRIFLKPKAVGFDILYGVTPKMAMSELSGMSFPELKIIVEDDVAKGFLEAALSCDLRRRVEIEVMGSADGSILQAVSTYYREGFKDFLVVMDGDKRDDKDKKIDKVVDSLTDCKTIGSIEIRNHLDNHFAFLPGNEWPEKVFIESLLKSADLSLFMTSCNISDLSVLKGYLSTALAAGKHSEFYQLSLDMQLGEDDVRISALRQYCMLNKNEIQPVVDAVLHVLDGDI